MNRLTPLIHRPTRTAATALAFPAAARHPVGEEDRPRRMSDARLFFSSYLAGIVIFGTFLA